MASPQSPPQVAKTNAMYSFSGACHCGAIRVKLELTRPAAETRVRACQCGFCRRHGTRTVADADGLATIRVAAEITGAKNRPPGTTATSVVAGGRTCSRAVATENTGPTGVASCVP